MKTYLPQIERRIINRSNQTYGILAFDLDNAYPQRILEQVFASPTAMACWKRRADYLNGKGFKDEKFGNSIINKKGLTIKKLLRACATDKAIGRSFGIHVNYNANYEISSTRFVKWEDIRIGDPDEKATCNMLAVYYDWGRKTLKNISRQKINYIHHFNPDPEVIRQQVINAGGWDKYKGQLFYFNPEVADYSLAECDSVTEDIETEAGIKTFNNRSVTTGFMPSAMLFMKARREAADNDGPGVGYGGSVPGAGGNGYASPTQIEITLGQFQGAKNGQKIVVIEYDEDDAKPDLQTFPIQNNDKLFEVTERSVSNRIIKGFSIPKELIDSEKASGLSNGGEKKEAIRQFNDDTKDDRNELSEVFRTIFSRFHEQINTSGDWEIVETPTDVAEETIGAKAGKDIQELIMSNIPRENKIKMLVYLYGFKQEEAEQMTPLTVPEGGENAAS